MDHLDALAHYLHTLGAAHRQPHRRRQGRRAQRLGHPQPAALHGLVGICLPGGVWLALATATAAPASMRRRRRPARARHVVDAQPD